MDLDVIRADHGMVQARHESATWQKHRHLYGVSFNQGHRRAWWAAVQWLLKQQAAWDDLTESEALAELRKGSGSIYYPIFKADPTIWADCPNHGRTAITAEGICPHCAYEWT